MFYENWFHIEIAHVIIFFPYLFRKNIVQYKMGLKRSVSLTIMAALPCTAEKYILAGIILF